MYYLKMIIYYYNILNCGRFIKIKKKLKKLFIIIGTISALIFLVVFLYQSAQDQKEAQQKQDELINTKIERVISNATKEEYEVYINEVSSGFATDSYLVYNAYNKQYSQNYIDEHKKLKSLSLLGENSKEVEKILIPKTNEKLKIKALKVNADTIIICEVDDYKISNEKLKNIIKEVYKFK